MPCSITCWTGGTTHQLQEAWFCLHSMGQEGVGSLEHTGNGSSQWALDSSGHILPKEDSEPTHLVDLDSTYVETSQSPGSRVLLVHWPVCGSQGSSSLFGELRSILNNVLWHPVRTVRTTVQTKLLRSGGQIEELVEVYSGTTLNICLLLQEWWCCHRRGADL